MFCDVNRLNFSRWKSWHFFFFIALFRSFTYNYFNIPRRLRQFSGPNYLPVPQKSQGESRPSSGTILSSTTRKGFNEQQIISTNGSSWTEYGATQKSYWLPEGEYINGQSKWIGVVDWVCYWTEGIHGIFSSLIIVAIRNIFSQRYFLAWPGGRTREIILIACVL